MATTLNKRKYEETSKQGEEAVDMNTGDDSEEEAESDDSESEESVYSGLEEEEMTDSDEEETDEEEEEDEEDEKFSNEDDDEVHDKSQSTAEDTAKQDTHQPEKSTDNEPTSNTTDEYEYDSSDEEDLRNTIGNVPIEWYRQFDHIGYDILGKKIMKPQSGDKLDEFLNRMDNPDYWRTVRDKSTGQNVVLSDKDAELVKSYRAGHYASSTAPADSYEPWIDFFTNEVMIHPLKNTPASKRSFIPSLWEKKKVSQYVHAIKMGWMKPKKPQTEEEEEDKFYELWSTDDQSEISRRFKHNIPAPRIALPGHAESYNPPPEYLFTEEEELAWQNQDPEDRRSDFIPRKFSSLRLVPAYQRFVKERFERCLDLYLCPRKRKMRMNVQAEDLIPKVPKPRDLQPFPTTQSIVYRGHTGMVRSISVSPGGQWLVSGSDDCTLRLWEVSTGRCLRSVDMGAVVKVVAWNPNKDVSLLAVSAGSDVVLLNPLLGDKLVTVNTDKNISSHQPSDQPTPSSRKAPVEWSQYSGALWDQGFRIKISHSKDVSSLAWHGAGDYLVSVWPGPLSQSIVIHQVTKRRSQLPFTKNKGLVQCVRFHPTRPFLFVATQRYVRIYNLLKQELVKKLTTSCKWVSSLAIHPAGDNLIIGSYDCRLSWFDLDLSTKPYQTLRHQKRAIRQVCYHPRYPLFASCSDDGSVVVCHATVYNDLLQNPLIVPVKILRGHKVSRDLGVLDCVFHPSQPWIFSAGSDHNISLFT